MDTTTYDRGKRFLEEHHAQAADAMAYHAEVAPDLARMITALAYGEIYQRPVLDLARRQLVSIALLSALGDCDRQLQAHTELGLEAGLTSAEIVEVLTQTLVFCGAPRVLNALRVVRSVFDARGVLPA